MNQKSAIDLWNNFTWDWDEYLNQHGISAPLDPIPWRKQRNAAKEATRQQDIESAAAALRKWADALEGKEKSNE